MAITTRQELESAIAGWLNREDSDTLSRIPDFITLAENRMYFGPGPAPYNDSGLRCRANEQYDRTPDISVAGFKIEVPSDLLEIRGVELEGERALTPATDSQYFNRYQGANSTGLTRHYTRLRDSAEEVYQLWPIQGGLASAVNIYYYARFDLGDLPGDSNRVLQTHPALYLFGALLEAAPYLKFTSDIPIWQGRYDQAFIGAMANTHESEYAGGSAQVASVHGD